MDLTLYSERVGSALCEEYTLGSLFLDGPSWAYTGFLLAHIPGFLPMEMIVPGLQGGLMHTQISLQTTWSRFVRARFCIPQFKYSLSTLLLWITLSESLLLPQIIHSRQHGDLWNVIQGFLCTQCSYTLPFRQITFFSLPQLATALGTIIPTKPQEVFLSQVSTFLMGKIGFYIFSFHLRPSTPCMQERSGLKIYVQRKVACGQT